MRHFRMRCATRKVGPALVAARARWPCRLREKLVERDSLVIGRQLQEPRAPRLFNVAHLYRNELAERSRLGLDGHPQPLVNPDQTLARRAARPWVAHRNAVLDGLPPVQI